MSQKITLLLFVVKAELTMDPRSRRVLLFISLPLIVLSKNVVEVEVKAEAPGVPLLGMSTRAVVVVVVVVKVPVQRLPPKWQGWLGGSWLELARKIWNYLRN